MGTYKDSILNVADLKWEAPNLKERKDGRNDLIITIPLTEALQKQIGEWVKL